MKKLLFLLVISQALLAGMGCKPVTMMYYGIHNPKLENRKTLTRFLEKHEVHYDDLYVFRDSQAIYTYYKRKAIIPDAHFFDSKGQFLNYRIDTTSSCNASVDAFIASLGNNPRMPLPDNRKLLSEELRLLTNSDGKGIDMHNLPSADYFVVFYFSKFLGKVSTDHIKLWLEEISKNRKVKIQYYLVSTDFLDSWGMTKKDIRKILE